MKCFLSDESCGFKLFILCVSIKLHAEARKLEMDHYWGDEGREGG